MINCRIATVVEFTLQKLKSILLFFLFCRCPYQVCGPSFSYSFLVLPLQNCATVPALLLKDRMDLRPTFTIAHTITEKTPESSEFGVKCD